MKILVPSSRLAPITQELLRNRPQGLTLVQIAKDTALTLAWLQYFVSTPKRDAAASRVETLYEYLTKTKLDLVPPSGS
jgi:hypothetical protein